MPTWPIFNGTNIAELFSYPAALIGDVWGGMFLVLVWLLLTVIIHESPRVKRVEEAIVASSFSTSVVAVLAASINPPIISAYMTFFPIVLTALTGFVLYIHNRGSP